MDCLADFLEEKGQLKKEKSDLNIRVSKVVTDHDDLLTQSSYRGFLPNATFGSGKNTD